MGQAQLGRFDLKPSLCWVLIALGVVVAAEDASAQRVTPLGNPGISSNSGELQSLDRYIVRFEPGSAAAQRSAAVSQAGGQLLASLPIVDAVAISLPNASAFAGLSRNPLVIEVVADRVQSTSAKGGNGGGSGGGKPGDGGGDPGGSPSGTIQWGTRQIVPLGVQRVGPATDISNGEGVGVAVLDTGVDLTHPDLAANLSPAAFSAFSEGFSVEDEQGQVTNYPAEPELSDLRGHGTHVAGIIGAANNNFGVVGVASGATLYSVKVLNSSGVGLDSHVIAGLQWVADLNSSGVNPQIKVVNMSLGRPLDAGETLLSGPLHDAIQALYDSGVTIVVSAGNSPDIEISSLVPAGYSQVVAVASTTADRGPQSCPAELFGIIPSVQRDTASFFTTDGAGVVASAPGEEMEGTIWTGGLTCYLAFWGTLSTSLGGDISRQVPSPDGAFEALGTSFAAPLVAGVVARLIQTTTVVTPTSGSGVELIRLVIQDMADLSGTDPDGTPLDHPWAPLGAVSYSYDGVREGVAQAP